MAKDYKDNKKSNEPEVKEKPELVSFNVWFSELILKNPQVKANHMSAIKAHFRSIGITELETADTFAESLKHYGI